MNCGTSRDSCSLFNQTTQERVTRPWESVEGDFVETKRFTVKETEFPIEHPLALLPQRLIFAFKNCHQRFKVKSPCCCGHNTLQLVHCVASTVKFAEQIRVSEVTLAWASSKMRSDFVCQDPILTLETRDDCRNLINIGNGRVEITFHFNKDLNGIWWAL